MSMTVSFIIPAFNESLHIGNTLRAINEARAKLDVREVIVLDNESKDDTKDIAQSLGATVYTIAGGPVSRLRNIGVAKSSGDILIFIDADVSVTEDWRQNIGKALKGLEENPHLVTGSHCSAPENPDNIFEKYWFPSFEHSASSHLGTGHMIMTREIFDLVGGFSELLETGEDYDICTRVKKIGGKIVENVGLKVVHNDFPKTIRTFVMREAWHGKGDVSSIDLMLKSKVVVATFIFLALNFLIFLGIFTGKIPVFSFSLLGLILFLLAISGKKFGRFGKKIVSINACIYYFYFVGRAIAIMRGLTQCK